MLLPFSSLPILPPVSAAAMSVIFHSMEVCQVGKGGVDTLRSSQAS